MKKEKDNVIRGRFRLGENTLKSSGEKTDKIMKDIERIREKTQERRTNSRRKDKR